jgi:hypothetical protein
MGLGLKHQGGAAVQLTICAAVLAALATRGTTSNPGMAMAMARRTFRME